MYPFADVELNGELIGKCEYGYLGYFFRSQAVVRKTAGSVVVNVKAGEETYSQTI